MYIHLIRQENGKHVGQLRNVLSNGKEVTLYETPEYLTRNMAWADVKCWKAFNMTNETKACPLCGVLNPTSEDDHGYPCQLSVDENDTVYARSGNAITGREFAAKLSKWQARNVDLEFRTYPFTRSTKKGFHLDVKVGNTPVRRFTVHKAG